VKKFNIKETYLFIAMIAIGISMHIWGPQESLDTKLFYTAGQANSFINGLSSSEHQAYLLNQVLDLFFLTTYSLLFFFLFHRLRYRNAWIGIVPGIFDLVETTIIIFALRNSSFYPPVWLGYMTCLKWVVGLIVVFLIILRFSRAGFSNTPDK
jgi:hypothetical protein